MPSAPPRTVERPADPLSSELPAAVNTVGHSAKAVEKYVKGATAP